jgi:pimeloyl-ACP methyl ester carboxylesterase
MPDLNLAVTHLAPLVPMGRAVLYVHGMSFPSALAVSFRFEGESWRDSLCRAGFDVWALDFYGFGASDRYPQMQQSNVGNPLGQLTELCEQLDCAVRYVLALQKLTRLSLLAHSAGCIVAGRLAAQRPDTFDRLAFFAPIVRRQMESPPAPSAAWRLVSLDDQWRRFQSDVPHGAAPVLSKSDFGRWGQRYLDSDPTSRRRSPESVKIPQGMSAAIDAAWHGDHGYDPASIQQPVLIIRGGWDSLCTDADAAWLRDALGSHRVRDVKVANATHLMLLETNRHALYKEVEIFLTAGGLAHGDSPSTPRGRI